MSHVLKSLGCYYSCGVLIADILNKTSSNNISIITTDGVLSSYVTVEGLENITIIGHGNPVVKCNDVGIVKFISCKNITIEGIQWEGCGSRDYPGIEFRNSSNVSFKRCSFRNSKGRTASLSEVSGNVYIQNGSFFSNEATESVIYIDSSSSKITGHVYLQDSVFVNNTGVPVYISHTNLHIRGSVLFEDNTAKSGGGIYSNNSNVTFSDNCFVNFTDNSATVNGGAIYLTASRILFGATSTVDYDIANKNGDDIHNKLPEITFGSNSNVKFNSNKASNGGALYCVNSSHITFKGNPSVIFINNEASKVGGAVYCSSTTFDGNSSVTLNFTNNKASGEGGAVSLADFSNITFGANSNVTFTKNTASDNGGALYCMHSSYIIFNGKSSIRFNNNEARYGGAIHCDSSSHITIDGNSNVTFNNNEAGMVGGAVFCWSSSHIKFDGNSRVTFNNNEAYDFGGAIYCAIQCGVIFDATTWVIFINNSAITGGAIGIQSSSNLSVEGNSTVKFITNKATQGGAIFSRSQATVLIQESCTIEFKHNQASESGGAFYITANSIAIITGTVTYSNNKVTQYGGAIYCIDNSKINITLTKSASVMFTNNTSEYGAALSIMQSNLTFEGNGSVEFKDNAAVRGGAFYALHSDVVFEGNISINFSSNKAENGGAISVVKSSINLAGDADLKLFNNSVTGSGGAMHLSDHFSVNISHNSEIAFYNNTANQYGGAIYCDLMKGVENKFVFNSTKDITFNSNTDLIISDIYVDIPASCNETCINESIINKGYDRFTGKIKTSPRKLIFNGSAVNCTDDDNDRNCQKYLTRNIMLGQKIIINAFVLDYYNESAGPTRFVLSSEDQDHHIVKPHNVLISSGVFDGVSIMGIEVTGATNYSVNITLYDGSMSYVKKFFIELIIELSPCHLGFYYNNTAETCECYSDSDIVSCSGSTSSIKKGYWFGKVNGKATVTVCPNGYCNFTGSETTGEFSKLSPVRSNQCNSQRNGTACGSCKEGYTLSFDSIKCVSVDKCTTGQTVLVVTLSILYWVVIVILVFIATYYHIGIGYLYVITYYYSMVDILLGEHLYSSKGLFTFVSIMSSIAKVEPQFLGQLCLITNMSGIDQQFIHYVHPLAVAVMIIFICSSARMSYKLSSFVSKGIIHVICFLLLLSYTSVTTTSLLLLRSLTFDNVDKVYTYLSPDIEYLHDRHLPYFLIAVLCSLFIAVGLPLLLLLEPFLNHKIAFTRIKPLLDQFQGCYKDKYRCFAAYYMICRLVIILIIIINLWYTATSQYLIVISNLVLAFIHVIVRPYESKILNVFDGFVLHLMIVVSMIPLTDSYDPDLLLSFIVILVILPLIPFLLMEIYLYKNTIKKIIKYCSPPKRDIINDNIEVPMREYIDSVIDDRSRVNATMCEM